jgi:hypothetical protein
MKRLLALVLFGLFAGSAFGADVVFTLTDPKGDDFGDGKLIYPQRDDMAPGDLDIVQFRATQEEDGTWFEATFARTIQKTSSRAVDDIGLRLDTLAKHGFFTINIDVYIDKDRKPGSGNSDTLPGRKATIDPAFGWEKAVVLTPRPAEAKDVLRAYLLEREKKNLEAERGRLTSQERDEVKEKTKEEMSSSVLFPTVVRVQGSRVAFFVPITFLGGPAKADWAYVVAVSGADVFQRISAAAVFGVGGREDRLFIIPIQPGGRYADSFGGGREDDPYQTPIVDIIVPSGKTQKELLAEPSGRTAKPTMLIGVVPAEQK